jgi:thiol:disulfide interchange protein DsbD
MHQAATKQAFERTGTVKLKGDWTNKDPEISALLKEVGRAGVPVYLYWAPGAQTPKILPQILTESLVISEISQPGRSACKGDARC